MSEHTTEIRIFGASAREVLCVILENSKEVFLERGYLGVDTGVIDELGTRADGVVCVHVHDASGPWRWPSSWVVYRHTSVSRGVDWEVIQVTRGDESIVELYEPPDGRLTATIGGVETEVVERVDADGHAIEGACSWERFAARHLEALAARLGAARVVLDSGHVVAPQADGVADDADVPF
jgi:hypothetical protein